MSLAKTDSKVKSAEENISEFECKSKNYPKSNVENFLEKKIRALILT